MGSIEGAGDEVETRAAGEGVDPDAACVAVAADGDVAVCVAEFEGEGLVGGVRGPVLDG